VLFQSAIPAALFDGQNTTQLIAKLASRNPLRGGALSPILDLLNSAGGEELTMDDERYPIDEDDGIQWHAGPVTDDEGYWAWNLIESPDLSEEWSGYEDFTPGLVYLN
jgi:hypothetical protein